jgi:hypothetical protein
VQAASRIAAGQWPYRDFFWPYGPGQAVTVAAAFELFDPSVMWWRVPRVLSDATTAVLVWALVRPAAGARWALVAGMAAALTVAQPVSANPYALALAFGLGAVTAAARDRPLAAGALVALALFWRLDFGVVAALAALAAVGGRRRLAAAGLIGVAVLYAPFAVAAGPGRLLDQLVGTGAADGSWWRLPFPLAYDGALRGWPPDALAEDLKDVLGFYLPLVGVLATAAVAAWLLARRSRPPAPVAGLLVLALGSLLYLLSRPDDLHVQPLLVCLCALVPLTAALAPPRAVRLGMACVLGLVLLAGAANRLSALLLPPAAEPVRLPGVPGIRVEPAEARALPGMVSAVQRLVPPGEPIYVAPRRSDLVTLTNPLVHFLVRRPNVLARDVIVQGRPGEQRRIVAALRRSPPRAVVRWTDPISARPEPNRRGRPSGSRELDEYLAAAYERRASFGAYDVLAPR